MDAQECFVFANPAGEAIFGVPRGGLVGRNLFEFVRPDQRDIIQAQSNVRREAKRSEYQVQIICADGEMRYLHVTASPRMQEGRYSGAFAVFSDITERKQAEENRRKSHEELRMLADHLQTIREEERKRLAREFHDQLGQSMTALKMDLVLLLRMISDEKQDIQRKLVAEELRSMQKLVEDTVRLIWNIIAELRPQMLDDLGLLAAFEWETKEFKLRTGICCSFE